MLAVVDIPAFPLQLVLLKHEDWREDPVVVVEEHKPLAPILWLNRHARQYRIYRGMRFGSAQALTARLRAATVPDRQIKDAVQDIFRGLLAYSPRVEPSMEWPGLFWLDPNGLEGIFGSIEQWASDVHAYLSGLGFISSVVVGHQRFYVFALARTHTGPYVAKSKRQETQQAKQVSLARLNLSPKLLDEMTVLGVYTLGDFTRLPGHELRVRYGEQAEALHRLATGKKWTPLQPQELCEPVRAELQVDPPDDNRTRLLFGLKANLHQIVEQLTARCEAVTALTLMLQLEHAQDRSERIETASPTLDVVQLTDLIRLRLSTLTLAAPVEHITVVADSVRIHPQQISLLQAKRRDLEAAARAFARLKAMFGHKSVVVPMLRDAILPEAKYTWEPLVKLDYPEPGVREPRPMVRQVFQQPLVLPAIPKHEPERWLGMHGAVEQMLGPFRISGGWWRRRVTRDYYYVETKTGELLWLYYDGPRRHWVLHGLVD